jgi:phosphatidylethanolamine/phosphatidyl-N-methylethanolamine N-methyltransferase
MRHNAMFFARWLRDPRGMGSVVPSGRTLALAMAAPAAEAYKTPILELGGGTGTVTAALLECGLDAHDLIVIERDQHLYQHLAKRFPRARVLRGDAAHAHRLLAQMGVEAVGAVVSSLPLLSMPLLARRRILGSGFRALCSDGFLLQFTYGPVSPLPDRMLTTLGLRGRPIDRVWRNVPPATVWRYERHPFLAAATPSADP